MLSWLSIANIVILLIFASVLAVLVFTELEGRRLHRMGVLAIILLTIASINALIIYIKEF